MADASGFRFVPRSGGRLYQGWATRTSRPDLLVGFLAPPGTSAAELTLADSWAVADGVYLFLGAPVRSTPAFAEGLGGLLATRTWAGARLLWIADPNLAVGQWDPVGISLVDLGASRRDARDAHTFPVPQLRVRPQRRPGRSRSTRTRRRSPSVPGPPVRSG